MKRVSKKFVIVLALLAITLLGLFAVPSWQAVVRADDACTAPAWQASGVYLGNDLVTHNSHQWRAKWWTTNEEPGTTGPWGVWEDQGVCNGSPTATAEPPTSTSTAVPPTATATTPVVTTTATPSGGSCTEPQYVAGATYNINDVVQNAGEKYQCDIAGWCSSNAAWAYEPGVGAHWQQAWSSLGACDGGSTPVPTATSPSTPVPTTVPTNTPVPTSTPVATSTPVDPTPTPIVSPTATSEPPYDGDKEVVAYFAQWGVYQRNYHVQNIVTSGSADDITVINYAFGHIVNGECVMRTQTGVMDAYADYQKSYTAAQSVDGVADVWNQPLRGNFNQLKKLKEMYPHIKIMISLGGWTWSEDMSDAALTPQSRAQAVASCIDIYLRGNLPVEGGAGGDGAAFGVFDGIDVDWEYPAAPGNTNNYRPEDATNFPLFLQEFRTQMDALEVETGREYLLTVATAAGVDKYSLIDWNQVHPHLDWINLMTYDLHGAFESTTNMNAPLYASPNDPGSYPSNSYSVDKAVVDYLAAGVPHSKLIVGLPFYGRGWRGVPSGSNNGLYQPATGGAPGTYESGIEDYKVLKNLNYPLFRDPITQVPWLYNGDIFWSFDDPISIANKVQYINTKGLRGAMVWALDGDDANGTLMNAVGSNLGN